MPRPLRIFLIEDDHDDRELLEVALTDNGIKYDLEWINKGDMIISWLQNKETRVPDLIIMDLNLPKLHGKEVICKIKENPRFSKIPLLVLTTSSSNEDKQYCLDKGADVFMSKPSDMDGFAVLVKTIVGMGQRKPLSS
jgi:DNA-binding response OmpR family regulator